MREGNGSQTPTAATGQRGGVSGHITGTAYIWHPSELPWAVSFFALHKALPIYHDPDGPSGREDEQEDGSYAFRMRTRCGLIRYEETVNAADICDSSRTPEYWLPSRHAVRFGKPCVRCWPEIKEYDDGDE